MKSIKHKVVLCIATCFKLGFVARAPGSVTSLVAMFFLPIIIFLNNIASIVILCLLSILGKLTADEYIDEKNSDPSEVVIDEFVGMLLTFYIVQCLATITLFTVCSSYIAFRTLDIFKPWPISWIDQTIKGGTGIMLDDIVAGVVSGFLIVFITDFI